MAVSQRKQRATWITPAVSFLAVTVGFLAWLLWPAGDTGPVTLRARTERYSVVFSLDNQKGGTGSGSLIITDSRGAPVAPRVVVVEPAMPRMGHAGVAVPTIPVRPGHYQVVGLTLPMSGQWEITVRLSGALGSDQVTFPVLVRE